MKNPYPKSKPRIHPAPSPFALLPAAILALVAAMSCEDREVLAYLLLRSTRTPASMVQERRKCRKQAAADAPHRPLLDCPCFDCYTCFWTRWDASPHRELIHDAIDAFEEQLAKGETAKKGGGRRRDRRAAPAPAPTAAADEPAEVLVEAAAFPAAEDVKAEDIEVGWEATEAPAAEVVPVAAAPAAEIATATAGRKGWPDVMGILNLRLWGLWNPYI